MNREIFDYIKANWDCITYANSVLGLPVHKDGDRCKSFRPDASRNDSLVVYHDYFCDWGGDLFGDVIDLCALSQHGGDKSAAIRELAGNFLSSQNQEWLEYTKKLEEKISAWHSQLRQKDYDYLHARGIQDATIERLRLGYDSKNDRLTFPYWQNGHAVYYASRDRSGNPDASKYKKAFIDDYNNHVPWGLHTLTKDFANLFPTSITSSDGSEIFFDDWLCVLEGAFDAFSFEQLGFRVLSPICGFFNSQQQAAFLAAAKKFKQVFICFDSDNAGNKFTDKLSRFCFSHRIPFFCGSLPAGIKDVSDFYAAGGNIADLVANATPGIEKLASSITDKKDFADFLKNAARFVHREDIIELCSHINQFPKDWLKALIIECSKNPYENIIVDEIKKKYTLKYIPASGFFEYSAGVWKLTPDEFICQYIKNELGIFATNQRMNSICGHLKKNLASDDSFNLQNVFNCLNGTLNLDTLKLEKHSPAFLSSLKTSWAFDENATAPLWEKFIDEVMQGVHDKTSLLQEAAGYVLFTDCKFEKAFMLLGDGSNGKSVFINTLIELFGKNNCSNVSISDLASPFEPIRLRHSIANFTTELRSQIKGTEDKFKQCVSGEEISAAYKGKDAITFRPRAKWICGANNFIATSDINNGFLRRILFVKFNRTFTDNDMDRDLSTKLKSELPGIFNWVLKGYLRLKQNNKFTDTKEQAELKEEFLQAVNPIAVFVDEDLTTRVSGDYTAKQLYNEYCSWAKLAGNKPQNRINFTRNLRQILAQTRKDIRQFRSNDGWHFVFSTQNITKGL